MAKQSAGILVYRRNKDVEVLIVHPGGPFWTKRDKGAWSIPKGEFTDDENPLEIAKREYGEELGHDAPAGGYKELGSVKMKSGKIIHAWAVEGDMDVTAFQSNTFKMEWPPKSGQEQEFPEVDKAGWFSLEKAAQKLNPAQTEFLDRLADGLGVRVDKPEQTTLL